jgi:hypothetical protein
MYGVRGSATVNMPRDLEGELRMEENMYGKAIRSLWRLRLYFYFFPFSFPCLIFSFTEPLR